MENLTTYQWLCLLGIPALLTAGTKYFLSQIKGLRLGVKALLRAQMISEFNVWTEKGYAPIYARQNFENIWEQYHRIKGPNGVMDGLHSAYMALPTEPPNKQQKAGD